MGWGEFDLKWNVNKIKNCRLDVTEIVMVVKCSEKC